MRQTTIQIKKFLTLIVFITFCMQAFAQSIGPTGPTGSTGAPGSMGATGSTGSQGVMGATGSTGATGADGAQNAWSLIGSAGTTPGTNFIGTTDAKDFITKTNSTERMRFTSSGNMGIGTSIPTSIVHIKGISPILNIESDTAYSEGSQLNLTTQYSGVAFIHKYNSSGRLTISSGGAYNMRFLNSAGGNGSFSFDEGSTTRMHIAPGGNIGIGTGAPTQLLHVAGNARLTGALYDSNNSAGSSGQILASTATGTQWVNASVYGVTGATGAQGLIGVTGITGATGVQGPAGADGSLNAWSLVGNSGTSAGINFLGTTDAVDLVTKTNNTERMRITSSGNMGIGTSSPSASLEISSINSQALKLINTNSGSSTKYGLHNTVTSSGSGTRMGIYNDIDAANSLAAHGIYNRISIGGSGSTYGNFTFFPAVAGATNTVTAYQATVQLDASHTNAVYGFNANVQANGSGLHYGVFVDMNGYSNGYAGYFKGKGYFSGNVGIGTAYPSYQLQLSTDAAAKPGTSTWTIASDRRLKKDITDFKDGLSVLEKIHPVWFSYNGEAGMPTDKKFVGIIAQEMKEAAPYMVGSFSAEDQKGNKTEYLDYDANALFYILVNSVKEQQSIIKKQQDQITQQDDELNDVKTELALIKAQLAKIEKLLSSSPTSTIEDVSECCDASLEQNYPNPFSESTTINYTINEDAKKAIIIVSAQNGVEINRYEVAPKGSGQLIIPANTLAAGIYFYQLVVDGKNVDVKSMEIIR